MALLHRTLLATMAPPLLIAGAAAVVGNTVGVRLLRETLQGAARGELNRLVERSEAFVRERHAVLRVIARRPELQQGIPAAQAILRTEAGALSEWFDRLYLDGLDGTVHASDGGVFNVAGEPGFAQVRRGEAVVGDVLQNKESGRRAVVLTVPLRTPDGRLVGAVGGTALVEDLLRSFENARPTRGGVVAVLSAGEELLAGPGEVALLGKNPDLDAAEGARIAGRDGRLVAWRARGPSTGWQVVVAWSERSLYAPLRLLWGLELAITVLAIAVALAAGLALHRGVSRPLTDIARALAIWSPGRHEPRVQEVGGSELRALAVGFNVMADRVEADLAARLEAAARLRVAEAYAQNLFVAMTVPAAVIRQRRMIDVNAPLCTLLGRGRGELVGQSLRILFVSDADFERATQAANTENRKIFECQVLRGDGEVLDVLVAGIATAPGESAGDMTWTCTDITERRRAERLLHASEQAFHTLFDEAPFDISVLDATDGRYLEVNRQFCTRTRLSREQVIGRRTSDLGLLSADEESRIRAIAEKQGGRLVGEPVVVTSAGGAERQNLSIWTTPIDWRNRPGVLVISQDVTELRQVEAAAERFQEQLRQAQKMEAVGLLAGGVAHDFNNIITAILSFTGFALGSLPEGDALRDDLLEIKKAGERAASLTRQLLAFSRKQLLMPVSLDLNRVFGDMEKMLRRIIGEDVELALVLAPDLGSVKADPGQIEQVIMNLAINARDAMPEGGKLTIETANAELDAEYTARHPEVEPGRYVIFAVTDSGAGMDEQTMERIFEPFFTTKERGKGTGLGLSTVYGIVRQSDGSIWVDSRPGKGSTFRVYLPRELPAPAAKAAQSSMVHGWATGIETVLVVEDEEALRKVVRRALEAVGYTVLTAADGDEAVLVSARQAGVIHLLLTDVVMPHMNGMVLAEQLTRTRPELKVLYMSGYTDDAILRHGVLDPGAHFIGKPFTATDLARKVREVVSGGVTDGADGGRQTVAPNTDSV